MRLRSLGVTILLLGLAVPVFAAQAPTRSAARSREQHSAQLKELDSSLAAGNSTAIAAVLGQLEPELDKDERFALDVAYRLIEHRLFSEAAAQWSRAAKKVQTNVQASSGQTLAPAADRALRRRFAEVVFVQGLLTARLGEKAEALRLLRQADGYGFPPLDSPLMALAADCLYELKEYGLAAQAYQEIVKSAPAERRGAAAPGRLPVLVRPAPPRRDGTRAGAAPGPVPPPRPLLPRLGALRAEAHRGGAVPTWSGSWRPIPAAPAAWPSSPTSPT